MIYAGVDLGLSGGVAMLDEDDKVTLHNMPTYKIKRGKRYKRKLDKKGFVSIFLPYKSKDLIVYVEKQRPYPKQGRVSIFTLGFQMGFSEGLLAGVKIRYVVVLPRAWQKEFGIYRSGNTKFASYDKAAALYPTLKFKTPRGRIRDGLTDATLIATYGKRKHAGKLEN